MKTKKELIEENEEQFAWELAEQIFDKPKLSVWMILIPIILVFHMYRHQRYVDGRRSFVDNYLITRRRLLNEVLMALESDTQVDFERFIESAGVPKSATESYRRWIRLLAEYYTDLLSSDGNSFNELAHSAYHTRSNYLLVLHQLSKAEMHFNEALKPTLPKSSVAINEIMSKIDKCTEDLRRSSALSIFV